MLNGKFVFAGNLVVGTLCLTSALASWFLTDFFNGLHLLATVLGTISLCCAVSQYDSIVHIGDSADVIDADEWDVLEFMLKNYRRHYENSYKGTAMYESGIRDIDGWLWQVEQFKK